MWGEVYSKTTKGINPKNERIRGPMPSSIRACIASRKWARIALFLGIRKGCSDMLLSSFASVRPAEPAIPLRIIAFSYMNA